MKLLTLKVRLSPARVPMKKMLFVEHTKRPTFGLD